jgi:hypothetical protein
MNKSSSSFLRVVESSETFHQRVWKDDKLNNLVVVKDSVFTDCCIQCNKPAEGQLTKKTFFWHSPLILPLLVLSLPFYIVVAFFMKRYVTISIPLCKKHMRIRNALTTCGILGFPLGCSFILWAIGSGNPVGLLLGVFSFIASLFLIVIGRNPVWASQIDGEYVIIRGCHPDFLDSYPEWEGEDIYAKKK